MNKLYNGDCINVMKEYVDNESVDLIYTDLPFSTTGAKWDIKIDLNKLWIEYKRILKKDGAIVLHSTQPFTTDLINSNKDMWRYNWFWKKNKSRGGNFMNAKNSPIKVIEELCVFANNKIKHKKFDDRLRYNPQNLIEYNKEVSGRKKQSTTDITNTHNFNRPSHIDKYVRKYTNYPINLLEFNHQKHDIGLHPTQKPLALCEYIIKTYTNKDDVVLDSCMGAGTIPLAALINNRKYIGIELNDDFFIKSLNRLFNYQINKKL